MTHAEALSIADEQIAHWKAIGVRVADVASLLHCERKWATVRDRMVIWLLADDAIKAEQEWRAA